MSKKKLGTIIMEISLILYLLLGIKVVYSYSTLGKLDVSTGEIVASWVLITLAQVGDYLARGY